MGRAEIMPFNNEFFYNAYKPIKVPSIDTDFEQAKKLIGEALKIASQKNYYIDPNEIDIYIHGSYACGANIYFPSNLEIMLELKKTPSYNPDEYPHKKYRLYNDYFVETQLEFNPVDFSKILYDALVELTNGNVAQHDKFIEIPRQKGIRHNLEITPCFTFNYVEQVVPRKLDNSDPEFSKNARIFRGVMLYNHDVKKHIFTFPKLHARNGQAKDAATRGNFMKMVRLFKTLNKIGMRELDFDTTRGYFVQCLLFNVPNELFIIRERGDRNVNVEASNPMIARKDNVPFDPDIPKIFYRILNYLINIDFASFVSQNLVWGLFGQADEFWRIQYAHEFVQNIKRMYDNFPPERSTLVI